MTPRPLIGISTSEVRVPERAHPASESEPPRRELALGFSYTEAIERAGGVPVVLAPVAGDATEALLDRLAGVCLSGGPDLHPSAYGAAPHPLLGPTEPDLDRFEPSLARRAQLRGMPLLGICRGAQLLNVSRGGTLIQHVPERVGPGLEHRQKAPGDMPTHTVRVRGQSRLGRVLRADHVDVNSFHHQAVDVVGKGLRAVAWAPDGLVEAVEATGGGFAVGVQWHAECLVARPWHLALFRSFVRAAERFEARPPARRERATMQRRAA